MNLRVECQSQPIAAELSRDILQQVNDGRIQAWRYVNVNVDEQRRDLPCIFHDTDQTREENKIAYFHVYQQGSEVRFDMYPRRGTNMGPDVKLWLLGRLAEMVISHYIGRFESIHFNTR